MKKDGSRLSLPNRYALIGEKGAERELPKRKDQRHDRKQKKKEEGGEREGKHMGEGTSVKNTLSSFFFAQTGVPSGWV